MYLLCTQQSNEELLDFTACAAYAHNLVITVYDDDTLME